MATATLHGARSYHYAGLVFAANEPVAVTDKVAEALADLPQYFVVGVDGRKPPVRRAARLAAAAEPDTTAEPTAAI